MVAWSTVNLYFCREEESLNHIHVNQSNVYYMLHTAIKLPLSFEISFYFLLPLIFSLHL